MEIMGIIPASSVAGLKEIKREWLNFALLGSWTTLVWASSDSENNRYLQQMSWNKRSLKYCISKCLHSLHSSGKKELWEQTMSEP